VKAHLINEDWELRCPTIAFKHFKHTKTGHNLRQFTKTLLEDDLNIKPSQVMLFHYICLFTQTIIQTSLYTSNVFVILKIGWIMADNAAENVKAFNLEDFQEDNEARYDNETDEELEDIESSDNETTDNNDSSNIATTLGDPENYDNVMDGMENWSNSSFERLGCNAHAIQLVLKEVVSKNKLSKEIVDCILSTVKFFHQSPRYHQKLVEKTKLAVITPGTTRWNSTVFALQRFLVVSKEDLIQASLYPS